VRFLHVLVVAVTVSAGTASYALARRSELPPDTVNSCAAREGAAQIQWHTSNAADAPELTRWCRAVGAPVFADVVPASAAPALDELVVVSWNAHLAEGDLPRLIARIREGSLTGGTPVNHFVLLVQELYRRGDDVPAFDVRDRSAFAIRPRDPDVPDIDDHAAALGLSVLYVPSMRNGHELREDRGNAIISTEPLLDPYALELPLARQRRVALGAAVQVQTNDGVRRLEVVDAHLEPLSSPKTLWVFKNPRGQQVRAILDLLTAPRFTDRSQTAGVVLGGDFNTVRSGAGEEAYQLARLWSSALAREDHRNTHMMGRLDYLFFRSDSGWTASARRLDERFGSDHFPVIATFRSSPGSPFPVAGSRD
jgi:endonuclease/exonuclease/phosphatase family metal-dependent hydrolase